MRPFSGFRFVLLFLASSLMATTSHAASLYVATTGADANPGTLALPWRHIQKACNSAAPGDTVFVRGGVYNERVNVNVSGAAGSFITIQNYLGEAPIVDGTGLVAPSFESALFYIENHSYLIIKGFELRNYTTAKSAAVPAGIYLTGATHHIELRNNRIHNIENTYNGVAANALGIGVYGTLSAQSINNIIINGNELYNLKTGSSESCVLNGNVEQFEVTYNQVHDNNNIGIDFIGFEGTCANSTLDKARNGVCRGNKVWNIDTTGNPAYRNGTKYDPSAGGIYVDGGAAVLVERNEVFGCDIGIEVASEHASRFADTITVRNNIVYNCLTEGLSVGGYDTTVGYARNCVFTNNTLYQNDTSNSGSGELLLQFKVTNCTFKNNIFVAGAQNYLIINPFTQNSGNVFDYNVFYAPGGAASSAWQWKNVAKTGFTAYRNFSGNDAHSLFADPQFVNAALPDFHLKSTSPALNAGDPAFAAGAGETDFGGNPRLVGGRVEAGAFEYNPPSTQISINDVTVTEGNSGSATASFTVSLNAPAAQTVSVNYATANGSATAGSDYLAANGTLAFAPGETSKTVKVSINGDLLNEANEVFSVQLSNEVNATLTRARGTATILNDDRAPAFTISDVSVAEGNPPSNGTPGTTNLTFQITLSAASGQTITVNYATADGIARSTSDYVAKSGTLTYLPGQTTKTITVLINSDTTFEGDETLYMLLTNSVNASIGKARGIGTILNDDASI